MKYIFSALVGICLQVQAAPQFNDGDLIFQQSTSDQSKAIQEASGSPWTHVGILFSVKNKWYVAEAIQPVRITELDSFISRGKNREYRTFRIKGVNETQLGIMKNEVQSLLGKNYDVYFEWSDEKIYCSELIYKVVFKATGLELRTVQKFSDLKLDGPFVKALIKQRIEKENRTLNLDEPIVTPISVMSDSDLEFIGENE